MDTVASALSLASPSAMATSLLLVVHGRAGGVIPSELEAFALELAQRRCAPVWLQALTAERPAALPPPMTASITLVPLMLLPGGHVRHDIPGVARHWANLSGVGAMRRVPFVGAWSVWQQALAAEVGQLVATWAGAEPLRPLLLHHPVEGALAARYLRHLAQRSGARLRPTAYSAEELLALQLSLSAPALPLALAANRLTDVLADQVGPPLMQRERFRRVLLEQLEQLP